MKKTFFLCLFLWLFFALRAQSFEGKIIYSMKIESKLPNVSDEQFTQMLGDTQEYFIRKNYYKSVMNGKVLQWQIYQPAENKLYNKMNTTDTLYWNDAGENKDAVLSEKIVRNADTILGYACDELLLTCLGGTQAYWFAKNVAPVDASLYKQHKLSNWFYVLNRTHALPLKYRIDNPQFTLTSTAVSLLPMKLSDALFALPAGAKTTKSMY